MPDVTAIVHQHERRQVGQERHHEAREGLGAHFQVERLIQHFAQSGQKAEPLDRLLGGGACGLLLRESHPLGRLALDLLAHAVQLDEHLDFRAQNVRDDRGQNIVDGPQRIAPRRVHLIRIRRDEDDRRVGRLLSFADELGGFQTVHSGHVDVEENDGEVVLEHALERVAPGLRDDDVLVQLFQDRLQREELVRAVVDDQDAGPVLVGFARGQRGSEICVQIGRVHRPGRLRRHQR